MTSPTARELAGAGPGPASTATKNAQRAPRAGGSRTSGLDPTLEENLCALLERAEAGEPACEAMIHRILFAEQGDHVVIGGPNPPLYRSQGRLRRFTVHEHELEERLDDVREDDQVFVFGVGLGEEVAYLLRTRPGVRIVVWERDPWLLRLALTRQDYRNSLASGRLSLALGVDLIEHLPVLHERRVVFHPTFRTIYADEMRLVSEAIQGTRPSDSRRWVGLGMGGNTVRYMANALQREGYSVFPLEIKRWHPKETAIAIEKLRPEHVVTVNYDADVAEACNRVGVPLVVWEVDPTTDRTPSPPSSEAAASIRMFTLRRSHVPDLESAGFKSVEHLPLGVDVEVRAPRAGTSESEPDYDAPVTFVGSSLLARAQRFRRLFLQLHASFDCCGDEPFNVTEERLDSVLRAERDDYSQYVTDGLLEESFGPFLAAAKRSGTPEDPRKWVAEIVASHKRIAYVTALADEGIHVWGDRGWEGAAGANPRLVYRGIADSGAELTRIYSGAAINVDVNRIYQPDVVPARVFDVLACGGFMIAEHSDALAEQFEIGSEIVAYRTLSELETLVRHYSNARDEARAIAERGLAAVRERHTMRSRVRKLLGY